MNTIQVVSHILLRLSHRRTDVDGVRVLYVGEAERREQSLEAIRTALELIGAYDPAARRRVSRYLPELLVANVGGPEYMGGIRTCILSTPLLMHRTSEELALVLLHEATHARLHRLGFNYDTGTERERIELICSRQELAFARKLPDVGRQLAEQVGQRLGLRWWESDEVIDRRSREMAQLRMPEWVGRWQARLLQQANKEG